MPIAHHSPASMRPRISAVFFDLDGTLYDRDAVVRLAVSDQYARLRDRLNGVAPAQFVERVLDLDDHGYGDKPEIFRRLAREWSLGIDVGLMTDTFWTCFLQRCDAPDDTIAALQELRRRGVGLGVITNGTVGLQQQKLERLGLASCFDEVLISEREGVSKPDPEIFRRALERSGVKAAEMAFVGDHPTIDVAGARDAGLFPIWKSVPYWSRPAGDLLVVGQLREIVPGLFGDDRGLEDPRP